MTDIRRLTEVQLIHRLNDALAARAASALALPASRAHRLFRALPASAFRLQPLMVLALAARDACAGAWLAATLAASDRVAAWAGASDARMRGLAEDAAIMRLLAEMERRVRMRSREPVVAAVPGRLR
jgi:hypothetical protein